MGFLLWVWLLAGSPQLQPSCDYIRTDMTDPVHPVKIYQTIHYPSGFQGLVVYQQFDTNAGSENDIVQPNPFNKYQGRNWTPAGQATLANGCVVPS